MPSTTSAPRVSFSNRIYYSDDASASTASTDDELYFSSDDESFGDESLDSSKVPVADNKSAAIATKKFLVDERFDSSEEPVYNKSVATAAKDTDKEDEHTINEAKKDYLEDNPPKKETLKEGSAGSSESVGSWSPLEDEPPITFRDAGVWQRPTDYLGGYGTEATASPTHRVKLRKSWLLNNEDTSSYNEFEEWQKSRATKMAAKKDGKAQSEASEGLVDSSRNFEKNGSSETEMEEKSIETPTSEGLQKNSELTTTIETEMETKSENESSIAGNVEKEDFETDKIAPVTATHSVTLKKNKEAKRKSKTKRPSKSELACNSSKSNAAQKEPGKRDMEMEAHEKDILKLKEHIAKLQRKLDVSEVRTISQLADLEEETTRRMREYSEKAKDIERKKRAKMEKLGLKEKAMKSKDLIEQLRRSNQKLRADGMKLQSELVKLKEGNQMLEEKKSFQRGYASQFQNFQKIEVRLAEVMNLALKKDMPKYEMLLRGMEAGVEDREKSGHAERRAKELYEDCIQSMLAMVEENCNDNGLVNKIAGMAIESEKEPGDGSSGAKSDAGLEPALELNVAPKRFSSRASKTGNEICPSPVKPIRRSNSSGDIASSGTGRRGSSRKAFDKVRPDPRKPRASFRGTRSPRSVLASCSDDDSSTCSIPSVCSDKSSVAGYRY